jgi:hypothetical protein
MLELALIYVFSRKIANIAREKGRSPVGYVLAFIALWVIGEGGGIVLASILSRILNPGDNQLALVLFIGTPLLGVVAATFIGFTIVNNAVPLKKELDSIRDLPPEEPYWNERDRRDNDDRYQER